MQNHKKKKYRILGSFFNFIALVIHTTRCLSRFDLSKRLKKYGILKDLFQLPKGH